MAHVVRPFSQVRINATADGDNTIIAGVAGKTITVLGYALTVTFAGTITIQASGGVGVFAQFSLPANGGVSYAGTVDSPAFIVPKGAGLIITNIATQDTLGHLTYVLTGD